MPVSMATGLLARSGLGSGGRQSFRQMYHRPFSLLMLAS